MVVEDYDSMTILLCVETCRGLFSDYAYVNSTFCGCEDTLTGDRRRGECTNVCSGQYNQICGGSGTLYSVYAVGKSRCKSK